MADSDKIQIIGIGDDGYDSVTESARKLIAAADLLVGAEKTLRCVPDSGAQRITVGTDLDAIVAELRDASARRVVVLATGDPLEDPAQIPLRHEASRMQVRKVDDPQTMKPGAAAPDL